MSDIFITIIVVITGVILIFATSIIVITNSNEEITQTTVKTITSDFINTVTKEGKITRDNYEKFIRKLYTTGNSYSASIEVQVMHTNMISLNGNNIGENSYYSVFKNEIESKIDSGEPYKLKQGDRIIVKVENTNVTFATQLKNFIYNIMGKDTIVIKATNSGLVTTTAN